MNEIKTRALIYDNIRYRIYMCFCYKKKNMGTDQGTKIENKSSNSPQFVKLKFVIETHIILLDKLFHSLLLLRTISYIPTTYHYNPCISRDQRGKFSTRCPKYLHASLVSLEGSKRHDLIILIPLLPFLNSPPTTTIQLWITGVHLSTRAMSNGIINLVNVKIWSRRSTCQSDRPLRMMWILGTIFLKGEFINPPVVKVLISFLTTTTIHNI